MKKILSIIALVLFITGCGSKEALCEKKECLDQIKFDNTIKEIDDITGINSTKEDLIYTWSLDEKNKLIAEVNENDELQNVSYSYELSEFTNKDVNFDKILDIIGRVNAGEKISYDTFVVEINNASGTLIYKSGYENKYIWVNAEEKYVIGLFDLENNLIGIDGEF